MKKACGIAGRVITLLWVLVVPASAAPPRRPDPHLTPGDVLTTDPAVICVPGYTRTVRHVPQSLQNQVYRAYHIATHRPREYEIDHLISLELGGSNSIRNPWPQSYVTHPLNAGAVLPPHGWCRSASFFLLLPQLQRYPGLL